MKNLLINSDLFKELSAKNFYKEYEALSLGNGVKLWWICSKCSTEWSASVNSRNRGSGCPKCAMVNKKYINNNYLYEVNEAIYNELDKARNGAINFKMIMAGSEKEYYWLCADFKHSFKGRVGRRVYRGYNCLYCSDRLVLKNFNDLETFCMNNNKQKLIGEYSLNNLLTVNEILYKSSQKVLWICSFCSGEWQAQVNHRSLRGVNCPKCSKRNSVGEREMREFIENYDLIAIYNDRRVINPLELDIYIPQLKVAVEYNGDYWHSDEYLLKSRGVNSFEYHNRKFKLCEAAGVKLLFVWEHDWKFHHQIITNCLLHYLNSDFLYTPSFLKRMSNSGKCYLC